jgi:anti-sigma regulatory factor (Ser/Thr protein kinase)
VARQGQREAIRRHIVQAVGKHPGDIAAAISDRFDITRQAANYHLAQLVSEGVLAREGRTRSVRYRLLVVESKQTFPIRRDVEEHRLWSAFAEPLLRDCLVNVLEICQYGFTEMVNNVIDHSESKTVHLAVRKSPDSVSLHIQDSGVGIFNKIRSAFGLDSPREAVFELSKGKLTTDPERHTGEGIFFTSRMFEHFSILSGELSLRHDRRTEGRSDDWLSEDREKAVSGTIVTLTIDAASWRTSTEVFDHYATPQDDYAFSKTCVIIKLAEQIDGPLISRSQAKRVVARLHRFKEVVFDFTGVASIGPAFADEIFRVYARAHPAVRLVPIQTSEQVNKMIERAKSLENRPDTEMGGS